MTDTQVDTPQADPAEPMQVARTVPGRECGTCTLCCKVMAIDELQKQPGVWCPNCARGQGCKIYDTRPAECRTFICGYLSMPALADEWKPVVSRLVINTQSAQGTMIVYVDPAHASVKPRRYTVFVDTPIDGTKVSKPAKFATAYDPDKDYISTLFVELEQAKAIVEKSRIVLTRDTLDRLGVREGAMLDTLPLP